jgi:hypothetical protein
MENINDVKKDKALAQWMMDEGLSDKDLSEIVEVRRQTVWRWRTKGHVPHARERKKIKQHAGVNIIFGGVL